MAIDTEQEGDTHEQDLAKLKNAVARLMEHFDTVQIFVTRHTANGTVNAHWGEGNWFARRGHVGDWITKCDQEARNLAQRADDDD